MTIRELVHSILWTKRHLTGQYHVHEISAIEKFIRPGEVCLDIGAHAGSWTRPLSQLVGIDGHVFAFEALPYYAKVLKTTLFLLRILNVSIINRIVTDHTDPTKLVFRDSDGKRLTGFTHIAGPTENTDQAVLVDSTTVDNFLSNQDIKARIAFVKIDVEGAEFFVVRGARETIIKYRPVLYLEVVTEYCRRYSYQVSDIFDFFDNLDYQAFLIQSNGLEETDKEQYLGKSDVLFLPFEKDPANKLSEM